MPCIKNWRKRCDVCQSGYGELTLTRLQNPRHPWQSWRNRYLKYVKSDPPKESLAAPQPASDHFEGLPPPHLNRTHNNAKSGRAGSKHDERRDAPEERNLDGKSTVDHEGNESPSPQREEAQTEGPQSVSQRVDDQGRSAHTSTADDANDESTSISDPTFTDDDKSLLLYEGRLFAEVPESRWNDAWEVWARLYPKATPKQWSEFYNKEVLPIAIRAHERSRTRDLATGLDFFGYILDGAEGEDADSTMANLQNLPSPPIKSELTNDELAQTPTQQSRVDSNQSASPRPSPISATSLKRPRSPMVIVPSPSIKRVRFSQDRDATGMRTRSQYEPAPDDVEVIELTQEANSQSDQDGEGVEYENLNGDADQRAFMIWQGIDQPPEDEKENSPRRTPPSRARERPHDALDLTAQGTEFRLEPSIQLPSINDGSLAVEESRGKSKRIRSRGRQNDRWGRTGLQERRIRTSRYDFRRGKSRELADEGDLDSVSSQNTTRRENGVQEPSVNNETNEPFSDDRFEDAREMQSQFEENQTQREDESRTLGSIQSNAHQSSSPGQQETSSQIALHERLTSSPPDRLTRRTGLQDRHGLDKITTTPSSSPPLWMTSLVGTNDHSSTSPSPSSSDASSAFQSDSDPQKNPRLYTETQDLFDRAESQETDLMGMPMPDHDSDDDTRLPLPEPIPASDNSSFSSSSDDGSQTPTSTNHQDRRPVPNQDTQGLLDAETPASDFDLPFPTSSPPSHPNFTRSPSPKKTREATSSQIDRFIEYHARRGFAEDTVLWALDRTSWNSARADDVLSAKARGAGLPRRPGIFSEEDDEVMRGSDARLMQRLHRFHGNEIYWDRCGFLNEGK